MAAVATNGALTVLVLVPVAVVASVSAVRSVAPARARTKRSRGGRSRSRPVAAAGATAAVVPLAALAGTTGFVVALVVVGGTALVVCVASAVATAARPARPALSMAVAALAPALAAGSLVAARGQGTNEAVALVAAILAYDVGAFVMGHGRSALGGPVGVVGGIVSVAVVAVFVAAAIDPPFSGSRPWVLFGALAILAPAGVALASVLSDRARLPALRRLDSLVLAGPAWTIGVALLLHR
jgi:hypothetical protein